MKGKQFTMKKQILFAAAVLFSAGMLFVTGCKKDDTSSPVVTLNGSAAEKSVLNAAWVDAGATAEDDEDGVVTVTTTGTVNKDKAGAYEIVYSATDAAGNTGTATRTVTVYNEAQTLAGDYNVSEQCGTGSTYTYTQTITASTTLNKRVHFNKFGDYANNTSIYADLTATTLTLPSQTATGIGTLSESHTFSGTGTVNGANFGLTYTDVNNSAGGASATCVAAFTKK